MAKRRTKEDVANNERLLDELGKDTILNPFTVTSRDLVHSNYIGSFPYTVPSPVGKYLIKQNKKNRGISFETYSVWNTDKPTNNI